MLSEKHGRCFVMRFKTTHDHKCILVQEQEAYEPRDLSPGLLSMALTLKCEMLFEGVKKLEFPYRRSES